MDIPARMIAAWKALRAWDRVTWRWLGAVLTVVGGSLWLLEAIKAFRADRPWSQELGALLIAAGIAALVLSVLRPRRPVDVPDANGRLRALRQEEAGRRTLRRNLIVLSALLVTVGLLFRANGDPISADAALGYFFLAFVPIGVWLFFGSEHLTREITAIHDQLFEETGSTTPKELRAERLFLLHRAELDRYYAQARTQSYWIFIGGLTALVFGAGIVVATLLLVARSLEAPAPEGAESLIVALLGGVTGILTELVAALIFRMYDGVAKALNEFHRRLVQTNHLYFGNLLIEKMADEKGREAALSAFALEMAKLEVQLALDPERADDPVS